MEEQVGSGVEEKNTAQRALDRDQAKDEACARRVQSFQNSSPYVGNKAANFIESDLEATTFPRSGVWVPRRDLGTREFAEQPEVDHHIQIGGRSLQSH